MAIPNGGVRSRPWTRSCWKFSVDRCERGGRLLERAPTFIEPAKVVFIIDEMVCYVEPQRTIGLICSSAKN